MKMKLISVMLMVAFVWVSSGSGAAMAAKGFSSFKAAFVRNGELWLKEGRQEKKLVNGPFVRNPKWSFDGEWLAYTKGEAEKELWVLQLRTGQSKLVSMEGGRNFQWAPHAEMLAYQTEELLQYVDVFRPDKPLGAAKGIGNYSWLPDGKGFFASSQSELLPDGWTPISLYQIPLAGLSNPSQYVTVHVLPSPSDDFFAVATSVFKWSADGRWIAFLAKPTASLSADSNTLCVITTDGVVFRTLDEMANNEQWFEWAERGDRLAYIAGIGREATSNKQLKVIAVTSEKSAEYTPKGFVDQAFAWQDEQHIVVSRAAESKPGDGQTTIAYPFLMRVELESGEQTSITKPSSKHGTYHPVALKSKLAWVERDQSTANVIVANERGRHAAQWIKGIDTAESYYEQWYWDEVLAFYEGR
ncbi:PD40 domain-containing protein [Paenibacillus sp. PL91]|uniref:PD40 domain-containing protein n=1 Tax=Paenibacillus sp. PL91 TaxID=2729538 RepID=UPI00145E0201|nr:PD40 domain-containing protein [Paenibacillus sp. PL91]MBC9201659.1 PD40 domain-containing protein [Paenibacillus sp. PL91]